MSESAGGGLPAIVQELPEGIADLLGAVGVALYVGSYLLLQLGLMRGDRWPYPALNLLAALSLAVSLMADFNLYAMGIEIAWVAISLVGLARLYIVHRYVRFTDEERTAAARLVPGLAKDGARRFLSCATWSDLPAGHLLTREGARVTHLFYLAAGRCRIEIDGATVASSAPGDLIGELTYNSTLPATATVVADMPCRILAFEREALARFLAKHPDVAALLEQSVAGDLRHKLAATSRSLAEGKRAEATNP